MPDNIFLQQVETKTQSILFYRSREYYRPRIDNLLTEFVKVWDVDKKNLVTVGNMKRHTSDSKKITLFFAKIMCVNFLVDAGYRQEEVQHSMGYKCRDSIPKARQRHLELMRTNSEYKNKWEQLTNTNFEKH